MAKIVQFKNQNTNLIDFLNHLIEVLKEEHINNIIIAAKCEDNTILTEYTHNLDFGTKQELVSHMQIDIVKQMIDENYIT